MKYTVSIVWKDGVRCIGFGVNEFTNKKRAENFANELIEHFGKNIDPKIYMIDSSSKLTEV